MMKEWRYLVLMSVLVAVGCGSATVKNPDVFNPDVADEGAKLMFYAKNGDVGALKDALDEYPGLANQGDQDGTTLMHTAAIWSQPGVLKLLIEHGGDINAQDRFGQTPLGAALDRGATDETIEFLEANGATE